MGAAARPANRERTPKQSPGMGDQQALASLDDQQIVVPVPLRAAGISLMHRLAAQKRSQPWLCSAQSQTPQAVEVGVVAAMEHDCRWPSRRKAARQASVPTPALCSAVSTTPQTSLDEPPVRPLAASRSTPQRHGRVQPTPRNMNAKLTASAPRPKHHRTTPGPVVRRRLIVAAASSPPRQYQLGCRSSREAATIFTSTTPWAAAANGQPQLRDRPTPAWLLCPSGGKAEPDQARDCERSPVRSRGSTTVRSPKPSPAPSTAGSCSLVRYRPAPRSPGWLLLRCLQPPDSWLAPGAPTPRVRPLSARCRRTRLPRVSRQQAVGRRCPHNSEGRSRT
jgi:hypothetical protein